MVSWSRGPRGLAIGHDGPAYRPIQRVDPSIADVTKGGRDRRQTFATTGQTRGRRWWSPTPKRARPAARRAPPAPRRGADPPSAGCRSPGQRRCRPGSPRPAASPCTWRSMSAPLTPRHSARSVPNTLAEIAEPGCAAAAHRTAHARRRRRRNARRSRRRRRTADTAASTAARPAIGCTSVPRPILGTHRSVTVALQEAAARTSSRMVSAFSSSVFSAKRELTDQDLPRLGQHALLACGQATLLVATPQVANDLGDLVHVAGGQLLEVRLVPARPVGRLLGVRGAQHLEDLVETFLAHHVAHADVLGVVCGNSNGEIALGDLQDEVFSRCSPLMVRVSIASINAAP